MISSGRLVLFFLFLVGLPVTCPALTIDQALSLAMEKNRDIEKAREYAVSVKGRYIEERAAALPQFTASASVSINRDDSQKALMGFSPSQYNRSLDLSLSQPLFTWGKIGAAIRAAEVGLKTADEQLRIYRQAVWRDVTVAFYDLLLARELHALAVENLRQKERHLGEAQRKYAAGVATDYDVLAAEVAVENARPETVRSDNAIRTAEERLAFLLVCDSRELKVSGSLAVTPEPAPEWQAAFEKALLKRPDLADLRLRLGIYNELISIAAADDKPRLDLKGGAGWRWLDVREPGMNKNADGAAWNLGVYLTYPFFDGFRSSGKTMQVRSDLRAREIELARLRDSVALEVRDAGNALREAGEILLGLTGTVRQAERLVLMAEKGYELGVKIRLEVEDAQLNLTQARSSLARAQRDYRVARVSYDWTMGIAGE